VTCCQIRCRAPDGAKREVEEGAAHPEHGGHLQGEQVGVEGDEAERVLAGDHIARHARLRQDALTCDGTPRQEVHRVLVA
jgi:hypothetical protein